ncbi:Cystathionine gamma-synthase [Nymphon striatum]|nr:Cystathionine gamma-synthase [Nymphon striatum]
MAAEDAIMRMLQPGDNVLLGNDAYGGTFRLLDKIYSKVGVTWTAVDLTKPDLPSRPPPTEQGGLCVADNTFATPYLQQPLSLGADIVVHSATKYIGGHSDVVGGLIATNSDDIAHLGFIQNGTGAIISPFDCYFLLRGVKTLGVRMDRHCQNAQAIVDMLVDHPKVSQVLYPGLPGHLGHDVASRQMRNYGGMVSFIPVGGPDEAHRIVTSTKLFTLAESLGAVESLIEVPAGMTHGSTAGSPLEVDSSLVRLSVGIEDIEDLLADLSAALG